jgi:hypothetical protein
VCDGCCEDEAFGDVARGEIEAKGDGGEAHGGGEGERDGKPAEAADDEALDGTLGPGGDGALPIALVKENGAEVADDVDDAEDEATLRRHGEVRAAAVAGDGAGICCGSGQRLARGGYR